MRRCAIAVALAALLAAAPPAPAHEGDPDYLSQVDAIVPAVPGISVEVLNRDDRLLLRNTGDADVLIRGYEDEPYARVKADGTVEVNENSEAHYLNDDRFAEVELPDGLDPGAAPRWKEVSRTGRFEWHDHRAHWMAKTQPPQVTDPDVRTKVFAWTVPLEVGGEAGAIRGTLFWTPQSGGGGIPAAAVAALAGVLIAAFLAVFAVRRRRTPGPAAEAW